MVLCDREVEGGGGGGEKNSLSQFSVPNFSVLSGSLKKDVKKSATSESVTLEIIFAEGD